MTNKFSKTIMLLAVVSLGLSGCSMFNKTKSLEVLKNSNQIPSTKDLLNNLPEGLVADTTNARSSGESLKSGDDN